MKNAGLLVIIIGLILLTFPAVISACDNGEEVTDVNEEVKIPPIDAARPSVTETATFALG